MPQKGLTELWVSRINDYRQRPSGERAAAWCERHQVTPCQLWYWLRKLGKVERPSPPASKPQFVALRLDDKATDSASPLLVRVGAATIEVRPGFEPTLFADVVRTLKALC